MGNTSPSPADALITFTVRNVRCYRDETTLSLEATRLANSDVVRCVNTALANPEKVLPAAGVFGANAAGKTMLLKAIEDMRTVILYSFRRGESGSGIYRRPFLLGPDKAEPSMFEVDLILNGVRWLYGFEIDDKCVRREFACHYPRGRQALVFEREDQQVTFGAPFRPAGKAMRPLLRENALLLSVAGATGADGISPLFGWWASNFGLADFGNRKSRTAFTAKIVKDESMRGRVLNLLRAADLGVTDLDIVHPDAEELERFKRGAASMLDEFSEGVDSEVIESLLYSIQLTHQGQNQQVQFDADEESAGTLVWVGLAGPVIHALDNGAVLLVDELDASLHPHLVVRLVELFQNPATNPRCAQLIFNSHDMNVLSNWEWYALGRDQIWFAEKDADGASHLTALAEFRTRRDESIRRRYLHGRYGGVPNLGFSDFQRAAQQ